MVWMCPVCWETSHAGARRCARCLANLEALDRGDFEEMLVNALRDPDPDAVVRAADILSRCGDADEVLPLLAKAFVEHSHEPSLASGILRAIGRYRGSDSRRLLVEALAHESIIVRTAAAEALQSQANGDR